MTASEKQRIGFGNVLQRIRDIRCQTRSHICVSFQATHHLLSNPGLCDHKVGAQEMRKWWLIVRQSLKKVDYLRSTRITKQLLSTKCLFIQASGHLKRKTDYRVNTEHCLYCAPRYLSLFNLATLKLHPGSDLPIWTFSAWSDYHDKLNDRKSGHLPFVRMVNLLAFKDRSIESSKSDAQIFICQNGMAVI